MDNVTDTNGGDGDAKNKHNAMLEHTFLNLLSLQGASVHATTPDIRTHTYFVSRIVFLIKRNLIFPNIQGRQEQRFVLLKFSIDGAL